MTSIDPIFIRPLLSKDGTWSAYRIEFAPGATCFDALAGLGKNQFDGFDARHPWLFPVLPDSVGHDVGGERNVTVIPSQPAAADAGWIAQIEDELRRNKRRLALEIAAGAPLPPADKTWNHMLISAGAARALPPYGLLGLSSRTSLIATDVHSLNDRHWLFDNGCQLATGEYLLVRSNQRENQADITRLKLLKLLALIAEDADTAELERIFREEAKLSYSLMRLVNSAAVSPRSPINSFSQAINLLGRRQLQRWLQLLVYSDPDNGQQANPLLQKAAMRGHLLELMARCLDGGQTAEEGDTAFMIGAFSLLDVLLNLPMQEILKQLPLPQVAREALNDRAGSYGKLLDVIEAADRHELGAAAASLRETGITAECYRDGQIESLAWAASIRHA